MKTIFAIFLILFSITAAADEWTEADTQREIAFIALSVIDWRQTMDIANHPQSCNAITHRCVDGLVEVNPILGEHPSNAKINTYFTLGILTQYAIARILPSDLRAPWQTVGIVFEAYYINNNINIGLSAKF